MRFITLDYGTQTLLVLVEEVLYVVPKDDEPGTNIIKFKSGQEIYSTNTIVEILALLEDQP
jgi:hypothetical protein